MTAVPAVLALADRRAWYLPRWLGRMLPDLDIESAGIERQPYATSSVNRTMPPARTG